MVTVVILWSFWWHCTVAEPVTVLDALEHMFASCSMHSTAFEAILNETKMTATINSN